MIIKSKWLIYNEKTDIQKGPISYFDAWKYISRLPRESLSSIYATDSSSINCQWARIEDIQCFADLIARKKGQTRHLSPHHTLLAQISKLEGNKVAIRKPQRGAGVTANNVITIKSGEALMKDRRRYTRFPLAFPLLVKFSGNDKRTHSINISQGGARLSHDLPLELDGQRVEVELSAQDSQHELSIMVPAVARVENGGLSRVIFEGLQEHKRSQIKNLIQDQLQGYLSAA